MRPKKEKRPMTVERMALYLLIGMMIVTAPLIYGMYTGKVHTRWNYDDSEWHLQHWKERKMDLEFERMSHELTEMTRRLEIYEEFVNQVLEDQNMETEEDYDAEVYSNGSPGHDDP